jgi:hypothetical protein
MFWYAITRDASPSLKSRVSSSCELMGGGVQQKLAGPCEVIELSKSVDGEGHV